MKIGAALRNILLNDSTINTLLNGQIAPMLTGQESTMPFCIYRVVKVEPQHTAQQAATIDLVDVEFTVFSEDYDDAHTVLDQLRSVLEVYTGTAKGITIQKCWYAGSRDEFDAPGRMYAHTVFFTMRAKAIVTSAQPLVGILNATATAMCSIQILQWLQGTANASASATVNLQISKKLAATLGAYATATCAVSLSNGLAGALNISGNATMAMQIAKQLAGALTTSASATLNVAVYQAQLLAGVLNVSGAATVATQITKKLAGANTTTGAASCVVDISASFLFDTHANGKKSYALIKLKTGVTSVARMLRSGDSTESDFTQAQLDAGDHVTWVNAGGGTQMGYYTKMYEQSGVGTDITQTVVGSMPIGVNSGVGVTLNGKPAMDFNGSRGFDADLDFTGDFTTIQIIKISGSICVWQDSVNTSFFIYYYNGSDLRFRNNPGAVAILAAPTTGVNLISFAARTSGSISEWQNNVANASNPQAMLNDGSYSRLGSGARLANSNFIGAAFINFSTNKTADRAGIQTILNNYYGTY